MTKDEFWDHIRKSRRTDPDEHGERLVARLVRLPVKDILAFGVWWEKMAARSYKWDLWGAAYLVNGGCSDDGFDYFRDWLILQGREVFENAVKDPDSLADVVDGEEVEHGCGCGPAYDAYVQVTGRKDYVNALDKLLGGPVPRDLGEEWDHEDDDQMRRRCPRLWKMYMNRE